MSDLELFLWASVRDDDSEAFALLFRTHYATLCLLSKRYTNDITTSREVVQDIFIHLWEHRKEIDITTSLKSYLTVAVKFNSIRRIENDRRISVYLDVFPEPGQEFFDHLEFAELQKSILDAIESLPEQCKKVFLLSRFDQLKYIEIANTLSISVKTVEAHMTKAMRLIQNHLNNSLLALILIHICSFL